MAMEQVNLQELQRLNDAITLTFEAIRRVAPQLQALQQVWPQMIGQQGIPGVYGQQIPGIYGQPVMGGYGYYPQHLSQLGWGTQHPFAQLAQQGLSPWTVGYGVQQTWPQTMGFDPFSRQQIPMGVPFAGFGGGAQQYTQRPF
jgi:hypothetical protein